MQAAFPDKSIVKDEYFTNTQYYLMLKGFFEGMQFSKHHNDAENCLSKVSALLDDFYFLNKNHTSANFTLNGVPMMNFDSMEK